MPSVGTVDVVIAIMRSASRNRSAGSGVHCTIKAAPLHSGRHPAQTEGPLYHCRGGNDLLTDFHGIQQTKVEEVSRHFSQHSHLVHKPRGVLRTHLQSVCGRDWQCSCVLTQDLSKQSLPYQQLVPPEQTRSAQPAAPCPAPAGAPAPAARRCSGTARPGRASRLRRCSLHTQPRRTTLDLHKNRGSSAASGQVRSAR